MTIITISRQSGSEGNIITKMLSQRLGCKFFDKEMMAQLAEVIGLDATKIKDLKAEDHHVKSFWEEAFSNLALPMVDPSIWVLTTQYQAREALDLSQVINLINAAYVHGEDLIIVGRGSQIILNDKPDVLHVRIVAPLETRIQRWMKREGISYEEAKKVVENRNKKHIDFIKTHFHEDINNPELYDLIVNTGKLSLEKVVDLIIDASRSLLN
jgi:cytidylate kinase